MEEGEVRDLVHAPAAAAALPALGPLREHRVHFAAHDSFEPDQQAEMDGGEASASPGRGRSASPTPTRPSFDFMRAALLSTLYEDERETRERLAHAEIGGQLAFADIFDLFGESGEMSLDVLKKIVRRQTIAATLDGSGRDPKPVTSDQEAFWASAPSKLIVSRAEGLSTPEPPFDANPAVHPRASGDVMLDWHIADGCENCEREDECYIWSLRASMSAMPLPFKEGMRPEGLIDPEAGTWTPADLETEQGRAHVAQVDELVACGVLRPCINDGTGAIAPSHVVRKQGLSVREAEKGPIEAYDQSVMQRLAEQRANEIYSAVEAKACGRAWTANLFSAAQAEHRNGPIKWRLVVSLNRTVNLLVEDWAFSYINFADVFGPIWDTASLVGKNDLVKGFYCVEVAEKDRKFFRIRDPSDPTGKRLLEFVRLPMGYKLSPAVFSAVTAELERHFNRSVHGGRGGTVFGFFVDDLGLCGHRDRAPAAQQYVREEAPKARFKWGSGPGKDEQMAPACDITGLRFDSNVGGAPMVRVAARSLYTTLVDLALIEIAIERSPLTARFPVDFLRSTAGRTSWVAQTMYAARLRVGSLWYAASHADRRRGGAVRVASIGGLLADATWFGVMAAAGGLRGSLRIRADQLQRETVVPVFGDSSGAEGAGFGAICDGRALWHQFTRAERCWSIQAKELATFVAAAERWGAGWAGRLVLIYTDNLGNALGINSAKALAGPALALLRRLYELADLHGFSLLALWLPRSRNVQADSISKQTNRAAARRSAVATGAVLREEDLEEV